MCTVSFVSKNGKTIITSNRDEKTLRPAAIEPKCYVLNNKKIIFPKDKKAGGTWFAVNENGTILVLLNGASESHLGKNHSEKKYLKSRGLIVLEIISSICAIDFWKEIDLQNIEPFTLILFENNQLFQLRWNEIEKETIELNTEKQHIWSSTTLYSSEIRLERELLFNEFLKPEREIFNNELIDFHNSTKDGLVINRNDTTKTLSITQAISEKNKMITSHYDLIENKDYITTFVTI